MDYRDKLEISFADLFRNLLKKWRIVIICMLVCMLIGGAYGYAAPSKSAKTSSQGTQTADVGRKLQSQKSKLSAAEAREVELAVQAYLETMATYRDRVNYARDSIRMNLNPTNVPTYVLSYSISDYSTKDQILDLAITEADNIIALYTNEINDEKLTDRLRDILGEELPDSNINELIEVGKGGLSIMDITIMASTKEDAESMAAIVDDYVMSVYEKVRAGCEHTLKKTGGNFYYGYNHTLFTRQRDFKDSLFTTEKALVTFQSSLTSDQKTYYAALLTAAKKEYDKSGSMDVDALLNGSTAQEAVSGGETKSDTSTKTSKKKINGKFVFGGAAGGAFLVIVVIAVIYLMSSRLKTRKDLSGAFGLAVIGEVAPEDAYKKPLGGIDRAIDTAFLGKVLRTDPGAEIDMITRDISISALKAGVKSLCISGTCDEGDVPELKGMIQKSGKGEMFEKGNVKALKSPLHSADALDEFAASDAVILVEKAGKSRYDDIAEMVDICSRYGVRILGTVLVY